MHKLKVESLYRSCDEPVKHYNVLEKYCRLETQHIKRCQAFIEGFPRQENYVFNGDNCIAVLVLVEQYDMHHGFVAGWLCNWVEPAYRNTFSVNKLRMELLKEYCQDQHLRKYQRSVTISPNKQLIITKEI